MPELAGRCHTDPAGGVFMSRHGSEEVIVNGSRGGNAPVNVVVIGGGYSGVMAANRLSGRDDVAVTLVNPRRSFVERVRLHQLVGGSDDAVVEFSEILAPGVRLVVDTVERIDRGNRVLELAEGPALAYDRLVYAVGSGTGRPTVPGAPEFALQLATLEQALNLRSVLANTPMTSPIAVVGGGPLGIEAASEFAELGRRVTLVCGDVLGPYLHPRARRAVAEKLEALGVTVLSGPGASAAEVAPDTLRLADGREVRADVTIWAAGFEVADLARLSGLTTDEDGRLVTDETLTSVDDARIVATGDAASPSRTPLRMSCQAALPLGSHAADTVLARIAGERPRDFDRGIAAMCISLGRRAAVFQFAHSDDSALPLYIGGGLGARLKESACKSPVSQITHEARKPGSHRWMVKDAGRAKRVHAAADRTPAMS